MGELICQSKRGGLCEGVVLASSWGNEGKRLNCPNDVVVKRDGAIYFTDTYGGFRLYSKDPRRELLFNSVFMWKSGKLTLLVSDMPVTNGLAFSADERYLYVNGGGVVNRYEVRKDSTVGNGKLFVDLRKVPGRGSTDGLRVDTKGNLYETGPGGVWVISPEGKHLGTIRAPEVATNIGFGQADPKTLFIAARTRRDACPPLTAQVGAHQPDRRLPMAKGCRAPQSQVAPSQGPHPRPDSLACNF